MDHRDLGADFFLPVGQRFIRALFVRGPSRTGILVCPGLADEAYHAKRQVEGLLTACAARGFPGMRFDFFGCGESPAQLNVVGSCDWLDDLGASCAFLEHEGVDRIFILGVRFGAVHALHLAARTPSVAGVILWEPVLSLERQLRRLELNSRMAGIRGRPGVRNGGAETALKAPRHVGAYSFNTELIEDLEALAKDVGRRPSLNRPPQLVVSIGRTSTLSRDVKELLGRGSNSPDEHEHHRFLAFWESIGYQPSDELNRLTLDWVEDQSDDSKCRRKTATASGPISGSSSHKVGDAEEIVPISDDTLGTFHAPQGIAREAAVLVLPGERRDSAGPGRLLVTAARRFAREGYPVMRVGNRFPGRLADQSSSLSRLRESWGAMTRLHTITQSKDLCIIGLCSGASDALLLADILRRSPGRFARLDVILWSPPPGRAVRSYKEQVSLAMGRVRPYARKLLLRETWEKALSGRIDLPSTLEAIRGEKRRTGPTPSPRYSEESPPDVDKSSWNSLRADIAASSNSLLSGLNGRVLLVTPELDGDSQVGATWSLSRLAPDISVDQIEIPNATHNFSSPGVVNDLVSTTIKWLENG